MNRSWNFRRGVLLALAGYTAFLVFAAPQRYCRCPAGGAAAVRRAAAGIAVSVPHRIGAGGRLRGRAVAGLCVPACGAAHGHPGKGRGRRAAHWGLGGFAPAAVAASEAVRTGQLTSRQASALLPACVCSGPSFVILTVGQQMLGSRAVGVRLFAAQLLAGYLTAALLCRMQGGAGQAPPAQGKPFSCPHWTR